MDNNEIIITLNSHTKYKNKNRAFTSQNRRGQIPATVYINMLRHPVTKLVSHFQYLQRFMQLWLRLHVVRCIQIITHGKTTCHWKTKSKKQNIFCTVAEFPQISAILLHKLTINSTYRGAKRQHSGLFFDPNVSLDECIAAISTTPPYKPAWESPVYVFHELVRWHSLYLYISRYINWSSPWLISRFT